MIVKDPKGTTTTLAAIMLNYVSIPLLFIWEYPSRVCDQAISASHCTYELVLINIIAMIKVNDYCYLTKCIF